MEPTVPAPLLSGDEVAVLNYARRLLAEAKERCSDRRNVRTSSHEAYTLGRVAFGLEAAESALFDTLNVMSAHRVQEIPTAVLLHGPAATVQDHACALLRLAAVLLRGLDHPRGDYLTVASAAWRATEPEPDEPQPRDGYCHCEAPVMDPEHDAGCRRCGLPVDFTPQPEPEPAA